MTKHAIPDTLECGESTTAPRVYRMTDLSASNRVERGHLFIVLKVYFDGSGKDDLRSHFLTLAGFAGDKESMDALEIGWLEVLSSHQPGLRFFHMAQAVSPEGYFQKELGWTIEKVILVADDLNALLSSIPKERMCGFRQTVDLSVYRKWQPILGLPKASRKCAHDAFGAVYTWYTAWPDQIVAGPIELYYDRNETFLRHVYKVWCHPDRNQEFWALVKSVAPVVAVDTPPVQAADMLAWSVNRLLVGPRNEMIDALCNRILGGGAATWSSYIDEPAILAEYRTTW